MIRRDRNLISPPASLDVDLPSSPGRKELDAVHDWIVRSRPPGKEHEPDFKAYNRDEVKHALELLFQVKCAYCETRYKISQTGEVEHWRPKAKVKIRDQKEQGHGYEWLAMRWENLLPSCILCNRPSTQVVYDSTKDPPWTKRTVGKANEFPVEDESCRLRQPADDPGREAPLLLDPCKDDPGEYFEFTSEGIVLPRSGIDTARQRRAEESIRVYVLNRKELVDARLTTMKWMQNEMGNMRYFLGVLTSEGTSEEFAAQTRERLFSALEIWSQRVQPSEPYSQFVTRPLLDFIARHFPVPLREHFDAQVRRRGEEEATEWREEADKYHAENAALHARFKAPPKAAGTRKGARKTKAKTARKAVASR